jgi:DNA-directed RNA polymerase specialized sigma24 family protein
MPKTWAADLQERQMATFHTTRRLPANQVVARPRSGPVRVAPRIGPDGSLPQRWTLSPEAFERLLEALSSDREGAAIAYEQLRHRVIGLLRWWGALQPEELADQTLDRVARKLEAGAPIADGALGAYVRGIARMVFYESTREPVAARLTREPAAPAPEDVEAASECLDRCLASLDAADRTLLLRYYDAGKAADVRKCLADELGISVTALRIRTHRLRAQVERGMAVCLGLAGRR